jgi:hypothetical protein
MDKEMLLTPGRNDKALHPESKSSKLDFQLFSKFRKNNFRTHFESSCEKRWISGRWNSPSHQQDFPRVPGKP